ncbi:MAG: hypothetical protein QG577_1155 [Thermodesulfobacteriota bacterium]|nr:hypothetical protein [Thermodesulfobacteriota bacterium]
MNDATAEDKICKVYCNYYKPNRIEDERCRGFTLSQFLLNQKAPPEKMPMGPFDPLFKKEFFRSSVCRPCPFFVDGCDFVSSDGPPDCNPCGGLQFLSQLLKESFIDESDIEAAHFIDQGSLVYGGLNPNCSLKQLEQYYVYDIPYDDLYELNEQGFEFLRLCDGTRNLESLKPEPEFLAFCLKERLLVTDSAVNQKPLWEGSAPIPSLRYLEWITTLCCNLRCSHCYLGEPSTQEFPRELIRPMFDEFCAIQGLRVLVSGGEPTIYRHFDYVNEIIDEYPWRFVLLTNGISLTHHMAKRLKFHEVQISLDGMKQGHEAIRGPGTFKKVLTAMDRVREAGIDLSVASMVHRQNLSEWDDMLKLLENLGVKEWNIDYPCRKGRWELHPDLFVDLKVAGQKMTYGFGGSYHGSDPGWTCGRHLAAILPSGAVCRCALYQDHVLGTVAQGIKEAWQRVQHIPLQATECRDCVHADDCGGGCRYRAGGSHQRDEIMCAVHSFCL